MPEPVVSRSVLLVHEVYSKIQEYARAKGTSVNAVINEALRRFVREVIEASSQNNK